MGNTLRSAAGEIACTFDQLKPIQEILGRFGRAVFESAVSDARIPASVPLLVHAAGIP